MKVILSEDVINLGEIGDTVRVAAGYARNYLIPRKMAVVATTGSAKEIQHIRRMIARREEKQRTELGAVKGAMEGVELRFTAKAGAEGKLYGSVTTAQIAAQLVELGHEVDRRKIQLSEPIRSVGDHTATIRLTKGIEASIKIIVVGEVVEEAAVEAYEEPEFRESEDTLTLAQAEEGPKQRPKRRREPETEPKAEAAADADETELAAEESDSVEVKAEAKVDAPSE